MEILRRTFEEIKRIEGEAAAEEKRIIGEAESERKAILEKAKKDAMLIAEAERNERLASARLAARRLLLQERESLIDRTVAAVRERFYSIAQTQAYQDLLERLVERGIAEVGNGAVVHLNAKDRARFKRIKNARIAAEPADIVGGAIIESADGRIKVYNNLEALFNEYVGEVRKLAHSSIFKKGAE